MRRLIRLASWLYPAAWRARYGAEFEALVEDVKPCGRDVWDVVRGAFIMQMTMWNFGKLTAICGLAGLVVAGVLAYVTPAEYMSTAVMRIAAAKLQEGTSAPVLQNMEMVQHLQQIQQKVLSRSSLAQIITRPDFDLYKTDRAKRPLEDIIEGMRSRGIRIRPVRADAFEIAYQYPNKYKAQAVVRELVSKFVEQNLRVQLQVKDPSGTKLEVLDPASLPDKPTSPKWPQMLGWGLAGGVVVGLAAALVLARPARTMQIVGFGAAGCVVVGALSFLIPNQYISSAVLRVGPGALPMEQLFDADQMATVVAAEANQSGGRVVQSVEDLRRRLTIRIVPNLMAFTISFQSTDRFGAQRVVREVVNQAMQKQSLAGNSGNAWVPGTMVPPPTLGLQILDPASDPAGPSSPNRLTIALIGLVIGMVVGAWFLRTRRTAATA